jgi:hypothetical protein
MNKNRLHKSLLFQQQPKVLKKQYNYKVDNLFILILRQELVF